MKNLLTQILTTIILFSIGFSQDFSAIITATGDGGFVYDLTFGFSPDATDGYDEGIDAYAPPAPPPPAFDAALTWEGNRYYTQNLNGSADDVMQTRSTVCGRGTLIEYKRLSRSVCRQSLLEEVFLDLYMPKMYP